MLLQSLERHAEMLCYCGLREPPPFTVFPHSLAYKHIDRIGAVFRHELLLRFACGKLHRFSFFLSLTPGPPPFSSMNTTPDVSRALRMASAVVAF